MMLGPAILVALHTHCKDKSEYRVHYLAIALEWTYVFLSKVLGWAPQSSSLIILYSTPYIVKLLNSLINHSIALLHPLPPSFGGLGLLQYFWIKSY
jgi:hypothetical protein